MLLSKLIAWIVLVVFICLAIYLFFLHMVYEEAFLEMDTPHTDILHGILMLGGIVSMSVGLLVYRLFRGERTRLIKYVHLGCHTLAVILFIVGYVKAPEYRPIYDKGLSMLSCPPKDMKRANLKTLATRNLSHFTIGYMVLGAIAIQYIVAMFIFVYLYENHKLRLYIAPFHDIFGIWIFLCVIACYLNGILLHFDLQLRFSSVWENQPVPKTLAVVTHTFYTFLPVIIVVLSPYFDWELVGDI